jgi:bacillithiol biosynthesis cysteine-adding enzyme BshC
MTSCVVRTESLGGSKLSRAARDGQLPDWYLTTPMDRVAWTDYGVRVRDSVSRDWFDGLRDAIVPTGRAAARLERSAGGKGLVVTTGQQPGLFGGPLMSLVKAISARALADALQEILGMPVAPIFWAATDDADFEEAATVSVALDGGARELRLEQQAPAGTPMTRVPMGDDVIALAERLREASGSAPNAAYLNDVLRAYQPGVTVGDAYVQLLREILEPLEIAVLDASHPAVAVAADALLHRAVSNAEAVATAVRRRNDDIAARGFTPQVEEVRGLSLVFLNSAGVKRRLSLADAATLGALDEHQSLSSTVLLRPVLERAILPTAAYVAGPGEFAYFAQVTAVAEALESPVPMVVPRWSTSVLEPRIARLLEQLGVPSEALADPTAVEGLVARQRLSPRADAALRALRGATASSVDALRAANDALVPDAVLDGLQRSIEHRVQRAERRFLAGVKRREGDVMRQIATVRGALYPHGAPQERKLAYIPFLARYGSELLDALLSAAHVHARSLVSDPRTLSPSRSSAPAGV